MGTILIAALGQEEKIVGPDLVAVRLQVLGAVGMLTGSYLGLITMGVPHDGYSIVILDPIIDLEASTASLRAGLLVHPAHSGDRMVWVRVISRRLANASNAYAHDGRATKITGGSCAPAVNDTGTGALFSSWSICECRQGRDFLPAVESGIADQTTQLAPGSG
jgi:hypothetical protein